jgi:crotonobetainyl-CoA:carnitine CoA-transferase CaiB-like acyl-CoA transferase
MTESIFSDLQVVDLTSGIAGPITGQFFADFGAEVVKIETASGDYARQLPGFLIWNRGKKSVLLNNADPGDRCWLQSLLAGADVLIVNHTSTLGRFGLTREQLQQDNPALLIVEMPPYLDNAPWADGRESDGLLSAALGVAARQSSWDGGPIDFVSPQLLYVHGAWAAVCAVAALVAREQSGFGQVVRASGVNAVMVANVGSMTVEPTSDDPPTNIGPGGRHPTYRRFEAGDGKWFASGALGAKFETALLAALGLLDLLKEERMAGRIENLIQPHNIDWATSQIASAIKTKGRDEWLSILSSLDIPCGPVSDRSDWLDHPQVRAIGMRLSVEDPALGTVVMPGIPIVLTSTPGCVTTSAPTLGQHNGQVEIRCPRQAPGGKPPMSAGPLAGFRILDMGTFVAGPYAGALLAELGADVIKVEAPTGDPFRISGFTFNRGMRSLAVDLQRSDGVEVFHRLAANSDVVLDSLRPGVTQKLNIDYATLCKFNHAIISVSLSAYGFEGPMATQPGVDMVMQAMSGMMSAQGGSDEPVANTMAIIDATTAALLALTAAMALYHRLRSGVGQRAWASLAATSAYLQSGELVRYLSRPKAQVGGRDFRGNDPWDKFYAVKDGWIRIQTANGCAAVNRLIGAGASINRERYAASPEEEIAAMLSALSGSDAARLLSQAQVSAHVARRISDIMGDPELVGNEVFHVRRGDDGNFFVTTGRYASFSRTPRFGPLPSPGTGQHTLQVARDAGLTDEETQVLCETRVLVTGGPMAQTIPTAYR